MSAACVMAAACGDAASDFVPLDGALGTVLPTCEEPLVVAVSESRVTSVTIDTTHGDVGRLPLGPSCGDSAQTSSPQAVVAVDVPGTGPHKLILSTVNDDTDSVYDTILSMRGLDCARAPVAGFPKRCFDDAMSGERRSRAFGNVLGGQRYYVVLTGYPLSDDYEDRGSARLDIEARPASAPTLERAVVRVIGGTVDVEVTGGDMDGDGKGIRISFHDAAKGLVDVTGEGVGTDDVLSAEFVVPVTGALRFTEVATFDATVMLSEVTEAHVAIYDEGFLTSGQLLVPVVAGRRVGLGDACDASNVCSRELECRTTCQGTPDRAAACAAATPIAITPGESVTTARVDGLIPPGDGLFRGPCGATAGVERFFTVEIPAGADPVDLIARTDVTGTDAGTDTVVYIRTECLDPEGTPEGACSDDAMSGERRSRAELRDAPPGTYTVFVEDYGGVDMGATPTRFTLEIALRPVLASGATCDPSGAENRCGGDEPCTAERVCP